MTEHQAAIRPYEFARLDAQSRTARRQGTKAALVAAFLSALLPGVGHLYVGSRRRGWLMLVVSIVLIAIGIRVWLLGPVFMLKLLVQPSILLGLLALDAALMVFRLFAVVDAFRLGSLPDGQDWSRGGSVRRSGLVSALVVLIGFTALPHLVAGYYDYLTYDMLTDVFAVIAPPGRLSVGRLM